MAKHDSEALELFNAGYSYAEIRERLNLKTDKQVNHAIHRARKQEPIEGQEERLPKIEKSNDTYLITSGSRVISISVAKLKLLKEYYCGSKMTINQVCRKLDIPRRNFIVIKTAFGITKDDTIYLDEEILNCDMDELVEDTLERRKDQYFTKLDEKEIQAMRTELHKYRQKEYFLLKAHELVANDLPEFAKAYSGPNIQPKKIDNGFIVEPNIFDLHLGKLSWRPETGEDYDYKIARERFRYVTNDIYHRAKELPVERFLYPFGSDFWHIDNKKGHTNSGTPMDYDSRLQKLHRIGRELLIESIDAYSEIAPVDVVLVAGNHDEEIAFHVMEVLAAWYRNSERVKVWTNIRQRKYVEFGVNLIGYDHGAYGFKKLPAIMSVEAPQAWARTKQREWHTGHLHSMYVKEEPGVTVRRLPSITATDAWHDKEGFVGALCRSQTFIWCRGDGLVSDWYTPIWVDCDSDQSVLSI